MANHLFVCTANIQRSKTAEDYLTKLYSQHSFKSAGTNQQICGQYNTTLLTPEMLEWADTVWVMEQKHADRIKQHTQDQYINKIKVLDIEDIYPYNSPALIELLSQKVTKHLFS